MPKEKGNYRAKPKAKSSPGRVVKPPASLRTSGAGYNSVISGGITTSRISGAHYATSVGPPSAFMSDEEEDSRVNEMMRQSMISKVSCYENKTKQKYLYLFRIIMKRVQAI